MQLFSIDDVRKAWDDACTRIIPLASIHPLGRAQIREYFIDILEFLLVQTFLNFTLRIRQSNIITHARPTSITFSRIIHRKKFTKI